MSSLENAVFLVTDISAKLNSNFTFLNVYEKVVCYNGHVNCVVCFCGIFEHALILIRYCYILYFINKCSHSEFTAYVLYLK